MSEDVIAADVCPFCEDVPVIMPTDGGHEDNVVRGWRVSCLSRKCYINPSTGGVLNPDKNVVIARWNARATRITQQREQAAYERGKAEERARIVGMLEAEDKAHDSLVTATVFAFHIKQGFGSGLRRAIAIINQE